MQIDLNCDLGEGFGVYQLDQTEELLSIVTSVNIACGFHAGDPSIMRTTVQKAAQQQVAIGAHPGLPDLRGFGRRPMQVTPQEVYDDVLYQIGALAAFAQAADQRLSHVKPHGALYNLAAVNPQIAEAIAQAVYHFDAGLILFGLAGSHLIEAGQSIGLRTAQEAFADRTYQDNGNLTPRHHPQALITESEKAIQQVLQMVQKKSVTTINGKEISIQADTLCIHGDTPHAVAFAKKLRERLIEEKVELTAL
jgi:UPF0271 protein